MHGPYAQEALSLALPRKANAMALDIARNVNVECPHSPLTEENHHRSKQTRHLIGWRHNLGTAKIQQDFYVPHTNSHTRLRALYCCVFVWASCWSLGWTRQAVPLFYACPSTTIIKKSGSARIHHGFGLFFMRSHFMDHDLSKAYDCSLLRDCSLCQHFEKNVTEVIGWTCFFCGYCFPITTIHARHEVDGWSHTMCLACAKRYMKFRKQRRKRISKRTAE